LRTGWIAPIPVAAIPIAIISISMIAVVGPRTVSVSWDRSDRDDKRSRGHEKRQYSD
jgi:hypothetical protein